MLMQHCQQDPATAGQDPATAIATAIRITNGDSLRRYRIFWDSSYYITIADYIAALATGA